MENKYWIGKCIRNGMIALFHDKSKGHRIEPYVDDVQRFIDEGLYSDITSDYLRNTYGEVESKEHADFIIELAGNADINVRKFGGYDESLSFFCIHNGELMFLANKEVACDSGEREIKLPMPSTQLQEVSSGTPMPEVKPPQEDNGDNMYPHLITKPLCQPFEIGEKVGFASGEGFVLVNKPDSSGIIIIESTDLESLGEYKRVHLSVVKKLSTPQERLARIIYKFGGTDTQYCENLAKAILAGEIEGLVYKGD